jgi:hypothetical protein
MCFRSYSILCAFSGNILPSDKYAKKVEGDVIQFGFENDDTVPFDESKKLFKNFTSTKSKKFVTLKAETHSYFDMNLILNTEI